LKEYGLRFTVAIVPVADAENSAYRNTGDRSAAGSPTWIAAPDVSAVDALNRRASMEPSERTDHR